ncbi:MAG: dockerin type I domain-containing protein [Desulfatirhabdiaceae bacterium]
MPDIRCIKKSLIAIVAIILFSIVRSNALTINYTYDNLHRLTAVSYSNGANIEYAYDPAGNRTLLRITVPGEIGDVNGDGLVDLTDAILSLQVLTGMTVPTVTNAGGDVNADGRIGAAEAIHAMEKTARP